MANPELQDQLARANERIRELEATLAQQRNKIAALEAYMHHSPAANAVFDQDMNYMAASRIFLDENNLDADETIGRNHYDLVPDVPQRWRDIHQSVLETGKAQRADADRFERRDGTVDIVRWMCIPWYLPDGEVGGVLLFTRVIDQLINQQSLLAIINQLPDHISLFDSDAVIVFSNVDAGAMSPLEGQRLTDLLPPIWQGAAETAFERAISSGETVTLEAKGLDDHWYLMRFRRIATEDDRAYVVTVSSDIENRKRTEQALVESETRYRAMIEAMPDLVFRISRDGTYLDVKPGVGLVAPVEGLIGNKLSDVLCKDDADKLLKVIQKALDTGALQEVTYEVDTIDKGRRTFDGRVIAHSADSVFFISRDVTERIQAQKHHDEMQQRIIDAQKVALAEVSTPIIPITDRIIAMPLIGAVDGSRAQLIMRAMLQGVTRHRAKIVILDITGVSIIDSNVAGYLERTIQAARLKGARTIVTGVSDQVAETIVELGLSWQTLDTRSDLQSGLLLALRQLNIQLS